ncbi:MAG TPA: hypothetical protein VMI75_07545 [Polyangiaceae bacterium]|nr:hypothetical protein [Polyangiaceae bacterium]
MLALTACGSSGGQQPPVVNGEMHDASNDAPFDASMPEAMPPAEAAPPVDAGHDVMTDGEADAPADAPIDAPSEADATPPPVMCCSKGGQTELCSASGVDCQIDDAGDCTIGGSLGSLAPCNVCSGVKTTCTEDGGTPLACQSSGSPQAIMVGSNLICVCASATPTCVTIADEAGPNCQAECL